MHLPEKLKNKKAIINVKNRDNKCLRWALRAHLFPARSHVDRTSSYPTNDGLNFEGIDFPTPDSQISKLERQNPGIAINVFGWDKEEVIVYRLSEQGGNTQRINLILIKKEENTHSVALSKGSQRCCMTRQSTTTANISANAAFTGFQGENYLRGTSQSAKGC